MGILDTIFSDEFQLFLNFKQMKVVNFELN